MFGNCLWLEISNNYKINNLIENIYNKFNSQKYLGHFTLIYNIKNDIDLNYYKNLNKFTKTGKFYKTEKTGFILSNKII